MLLSVFIQTQRLNVEKATILELESFYMNLFGKDLRSLEAYILILLSNLEASYLIF